MAQVSVCIPTYNYGQFVGEAIESVLGQSLQDFEIIVSDNASTDETETIVRDYAARDPRIQYLRNATNIGMVGNWNQCLDHAKGEYVKFLCADDTLEKDCLLLLSRLLDRHPTAALAACARKVVATDRKDVLLAFSDEEACLTGATVIQRMLLGGNLIGEPTAVMFRRSFCDKGFDAAYFQLTDMEMWMYLLEHGGFVYTPEVLCTYRQHVGQETKKNIRSRRIYDEGRLIYKRFKDSPGVKLGWAENRFASIRPVLAYLYCSLYARFS